MQINSVAFYHKINKDDRTYLRCSRMASTEYCSQVRSDITTAASLKNLYSRVVVHMATPTSPTLCHPTVHWLTELKYSEVTTSLAGKQPARRNQRKVQRSSGRAGAYGRNLPLHGSSRSNRLGRRKDGDGSVLCLAPFFSSSP